MSFGYLAGITTAGAPDEIVDWFATFQAWMLTRGWIVANGGGTTNLVMRSLGEDGLRTMLFLHVYRDGGDPDRVRVEVMDDAAGTHTTAEAGYVDGSGAQFQFWMCGDMDAIVICFLGGAVYHSVYAGMVMPFALTVPDETYRMIATSLVGQGSILRDSTGVWDVDHPLYWHNVMVDGAVDPYDGSYHMIGTFFDRRANIAGQLKHVSGQVTPVALVAQTLLTTGRGSRETTWIVLQDRLNVRYAMRTGGALPIGTPDPGTFAAVTGIVNDYAALWTALSAHMTGRGWQDLGDPGLGASGRLFYSTGESGLEEIYLGMYRETPVINVLHTYVQDDAAGTNRTAARSSRLHTADFPTNLWIGGDRDCCIVVWQRAPGYGFSWGGLVRQFTPGLLPPYPGASLTPYSLAVFVNGPPLGWQGQVLRAKTGAWDETCEYYDDGPNADNSNPNNFDGETYLVWPLISCRWGPPIEPTGALPYVGYSSGGGIANMDTITVDGEVYTVFFTNLGENICVRTA